MSAHRRRRHGRNWLSELVAPRASRRPMPWLRIRLQPSYELVVAERVVSRGRHWAAGVTS